MKKVCIAIAAAGLLLFLCIFLTECSGMYGREDLTDGNMCYTTHNIFRTCFASVYAWTSDSGDDVLIIPDVIDGYRVTSLGGYVGSGAPCPFLIHFPDAVSICTEATLPEDAQVEQYHLVLYLGKHVDADTFVVLDEYFKMEDGRYVQILTTIHCSEKNPHLYSEKGKLYRRIDDSLVLGFFYEADYTTK